MNGPNSAPCPLGRRVVIVACALLTASLAQIAIAKQAYRQAFYALYPDAIGTAIETLPSNANHCGICHFNFNGGGARNPFGAAFEAAMPSFPDTDQGYQDAIWSIRNGDHDGDGYSTQTEITDTATYPNAPTFPGLTPGNVGSVSHVTVAEILAHLVPSAGGDLTPPDVTVIAPNGGNLLVGNEATLVQWIATDASGIAAVNLAVSLDLGASWTPIALGIANTGSHTWYVPNRPTAQALLQVEAIDNFGNVGTDWSDAAFTVVSPPGGLVPTTLRDFDLPGTQAFEALPLAVPDSCTFCHSGYDEAVEPGFNWAGSMMAQASRDPIFKAAFAIANQDAPDSGDLCLRCHNPRGWLDGRSVPTDGSAMLPEDQFGVSCSLCHRLVDPFLAPENPAEDAAILAGLSFGPPTDIGLGMIVVDPTGTRRGPYADANLAHEALYSPFHRDAAICGLCHDVSNPAFERDGNGNYVPNAFDEPAAVQSAHVLGPVERTYSEWLHSAYNTPLGIHAPEFGGNKPFVATCQDCHMRDVTGQGCAMNPPVRDDLPLHDMTGGSAWLSEVLPQLYPFDPDVDPYTLSAAANRARSMLQKSALLQVVQYDSLLKVSVVNNTGHKLPTGYPEGRRVWLNVRFRDASMAIVGESGAYDAASAELTHDAEAKIYEIVPVTSGIPGLPDGTEFHFVLNNAVAKDNRIPPRGFENEAFDAFGGAPVDYEYADGQYWDETYYDVPPGATSVEVTLYYQSISKAFVEFLRDANVTNDAGQVLYDLWNANGKCPPEVMQTRTIPLVGTCAEDIDGSGAVDFNDLLLVLGGWGDCLGCAADLDHDGVVGFSDLLLVLGAWGPCASDTLAPAMPTDLAAAPNEAWVTLDWNDNAETDLAGYLVLRATTPGGPYESITPAPIPASDLVDVDVEPGTTYHYIVAALDVHGNQSAWSAEASATIEGTATMHVASITTLVVNQGGGNKYCYATVVIRDELGQPVEGADVTGTFSGNFSGTFTETTDANGEAVLVAGPISGSTAGTFCVDDVVHASFVYEPADNDETCEIVP